MTKPYDTAQTFIGGPMDARKRDLLTRFMYGDKSLTAGERAWCADFTNASLSRSGIAGTGSAMARSFLGWGDPTNKPREGDVAVMSRGDPRGPKGHVGFYAGPGDRPGTVKILGGNQGPGGVNVSEVPVDRVLGFRQPPKASSGLEEVPEKGLPALSLLPPKNVPYSPSPLRWDPTIDRSPRSGSALAEAPKAGGWQWPKLDGRIAFGGDQPAPRAELPPPMALGNKPEPAPSDNPLPPLPLPKAPPPPLMRDMAPAAPFDTRSFFDFLDRSSYATGGTVMKDNQSKSLLDTLGDALRLARAMGGRAGYAEGGAPLTSSFGPVSSTWNPPPAPPVGAPSMPAGTNMPGVDGPGAQPPRPPPSVTGTFGNMMGAPGMGVPGFGTPWGQQPPGMGMPVDPSPSPGVGMPVDPSPSPGMGMPVDPSPSPGMGMPGRAGDSAPKAGPDGTAPGVTSTPGVTTNMMAPVGAPPPPPPLGVTPAPGIPGTSVGAPGMSSATGTSVGAPGMSSAAVMPGMSVGAPGMSSMDSQSAAGISNMLAPYGGGAPGMSSAAVMPGMSSTTAAPSMSSAIGAPSMAPAPSMAVPGSRAGASMGSAGRAFGGRAGYAEGGDIPLSDMGTGLGALETAERIKEPGRDALGSAAGSLFSQPWLGPKGDKSLADFGRLLWDETTQDPSLPMSMTGLPTVAGGLGQLTDDNPSTLHKLAGAGQVGLGMFPALGLAPRAGAAIHEATRTIPRALATYGIPGALAVADEQGLMSTAKAADADKYQPPSDKETKSKAFVSGEQQRLKEKKLYGGEIDGKWGPGIENALKKEWEQTRKEERALVLEEEKTRAAGTAAKAAADAATNAETARLAGDKRKTDADAARKEIKTADDGSIMDSVRKYAPWLGIIPGALLGKSLAKHGDVKITAGARAEKEAAEKLLQTPRKPKGAPANYQPPAAEKIGPLNEFYAMGQSGLPQAQRQAAFLRDQEAKKPPFWKVNPDAPQSSALYPQPPKAREYALGTVLPGVIGGGETALGLGAGYYYGTQAQEAERAMRDPAASAADVHAADAAKKSAETKEAIAEFFARMGMGTGFYGVGKGGYDTYMRPSMRPSTAKADKWYTDVAADLNKTKVQETAKASAKKAKKLEGKSKAAPAKNPNGPSGAAPLLPLTAGPVLLGAPSTETPSLADHEPLDDSFAEGGKVKNHWSHYQPRDRLRRFKGGPIYPNKASLAKRKGNKPSTGSTGPQNKPGGFVDGALDIVRKYASGGRVLVGPVVGNTGGRTDALPVDVPSGSYVIPADCVAALGEGNTGAGFEKLTKNFGKPGRREYPEGSVPIKISDGEFVVTPEQVAALGKGDMEQGHRILDSLVKKIRAQHIQTLSSLPPPATD